MFIPACGTCNAALARRFEQPSKEHLRRLFKSRGNVSLAHPAVERVSLWLLKTLLLHAHPQVRYSDPLVHEKAVRWQPSEAPPRRYYSWLVDGTAPPHGLSLWVFRADENAVDIGRSIYRIPLPTVTADGATFDFTCFQVTFHGLHVTLVVHPGWEIVHPLEAAGTAIRLWPEPPLEADLSRLPVLPRRAVMWLRCHITLQAGVFGSDQLPPLQHSDLPFAVLPDVLPLTQRWAG